MSLKREPKAEHRMLAAQLWCEPAHSSKEMDTDFAESIAALLAKREYAAFCEGRDGAIDNAAMKAYDMGRPDIRDAINALIDDVRDPPRWEYEERVRAQPDAAPKEPTP